MPLTGAKFVQEYAEKLGVPVQIETYDITGFLSSSGESKQQGARKIRYQTYDTTMQKPMAIIVLPWVIMEMIRLKPFLMRMLRGNRFARSGWIPPRRETFIRPLLNVYKQEILQYCHEHLRFPM
jgi:tRNA(Ile)-lysidine synthase